MKKILILTAALGLILAACGAANNDGSALPEPSGNPLPGTSWKLISLNGSSPEYPDVIRIEFTDSEVSGNSSCNTFGGGYSAEGDDLAFTELFTTLMACVDDGLMDQEQQFMQAMGEISGFEIENGTLSLYGDQGAYLLFEQE